jgi:hypothetical protein
VTKKHISFLKKMSDEENKEKHLPTITTRKGKLNLIYLIKIKREYFSSLTAIGVKIWE